jgi:DNA-binding NarL/FixJ family response regulator
VSSLRVVVADDSVLLREGLVRVLVEAGHEVVGSFGDAEQLLAEIGELKPDLAVLDPEVVSQLLGRRNDPLASLTPREREVLQLMAEGRTNAAIGQALFIGVGAVEKNVTAIFGKLGLEDSGTDHRRVLAVLAWMQR